MENNRSYHVLQRRSEFLDLKKSGRVIKTSPWLLVSFKENSQGHLRCGWTVSKKVGSAVVRNRLKRWCREFFRELKEPENAIDCNIVFLSRNQQQDRQFFKDLKYQNFHQTLSHSWRKVCHATRA